MKRPAAAVAALLLLASPLFAADPDSLVLTAVLARVEQSLRTGNRLPAVVADETRGGAGQFATAWAVKTRGEAAGRELGAAYQSVNVRSYPLPQETTSLPLARVRHVEAGGIDWKSLDGIVPRPQSLVVVSRPAFDRLQSVALVRADVIVRSEAPRTIFFSVEKQPDGSWKPGLSASGDSSRLHRTAGPVPGHDMSVPVH
ncbi:MAG TPA: hypothetical protein VNL91_08470 [Thermoanaerobaculia bacterium]|nr:hypothetical protein [Thermoanaerobaculia bacterium]